MILVITAIVDKVCTLGCDILMYTEDVIFTEPVGVFCIHSGSAL